MQIDLNIIILLLILILLYLVFYRLESPFIRLFLIFWILYLLIPSLDFFNYYHKDELEGGGGNTVHSMLYINYIYFILFL